MVDPDGVSEELKNAMRELTQDFPEYVEKFGDPLDKDDPRNWKPSERVARGVSAEDRLRFLELDVEAMQTVTSRLTMWMVAEQRRQMEEEVKKDPMGFLQKMLKENMGNSPGEYGPRGNNGPAYAGSTQAIAPDTLVETPDGKIRADQIPGYRNDPSWRPSPDWVDANCTCPVHTEQREQSKNNQLGLNGEDGFPTGFYL